MEQAKKLLKIKIPLWSSCLAVGMPSLVDLRLASFGCDGAITFRGDARLPSVVNQTLGEGSAAVVEGVSSHVSALKGRVHGPPVLRLAVGGLWP